ncbi:MAG TPA: hypothetical protein VN833_12265, partial [Candidatus Acidoferrales bacterium]|nr:hypothetical protein [Candidatus Acidoferrales bacterium]
MFQNRPRYPNLRELPGTALNPDGRMHRSKWSFARTLLSLTVFYFCSAAWIWALDPGRRISQ